MAGHDGVTSPPSGKLRWDKPSPREAAHSSFYNPPNPKLRTAVGIGDGDNPQGVSTNYIGDVMEKTRRLTRR
jgi:hypothetical protein